MAVYAIGDIQGCYDPLRRLLDLRFDPAADVLWLVGDLVNRGPHSVEVLRLVHGLGERAVTVLGNHDLTLLAVAAGQVKPKRARDTFHSILDAPDRDRTDGLAASMSAAASRCRTGLYLVHAGLPPQWDLALAQRCAAELAATCAGRITSNSWRTCSAVSRAAGGRPERLRSAAFHRQRPDPDVVLHGGRLAVLREKATRQSGDRTCCLGSPCRGGVMPILNLVFGHWASLGYHRVPGIYALDSGCVWGNRLTAIRLDEPGVPA